MSRPLPAPRPPADHPLEPRVLTGDGSYGVGQVLTQTCRGSSETWPAGRLREVEADEGVVLIRQAGRRLWVPEVGSERRHLVVEDQRRAASGRRGGYRAKAMSLLTVSDCIRLIVASADSRSPAKELLSATIWPPVLNGHDQVLCIGD
jgi:hypothetical protein